MGIIRLENMEFYAFHGHFHEEQVVGNEFRVDITLKTSMKEASISDRLEDAADYQKAYQAVKDAMEKPSALLEHVTARILNSVFDALPGIDEATAKVSKLNPSMGGKMYAVSVEMAKRKNGNPE